MIKFSYTDGLKNINVELLSIHGKENIRTQFEAFLNAIYVDNNTKLGNLENHIETISLSDLGLDISSTYKYDYGDYRSPDYVPPIIDIFGKPLPNDHPDYLEKVKKARETK